MFSMASRRATETFFSTQAQSIDDLIDQVGEFQAAAATDTLRRLNNENALLRRLVVIYRENWSRTLNMLAQTEQALIALHKALDAYMDATRAAEQDWLSFWKVQNANTSSTNETVTGWI